MIFASFVGQSYRMESLPISAQRCVNWYLEGQDDPGASSQAVLQPTPGYKEVVEVDDNTLPAGSFCRGIYRTTRGLGTVPNSNGSVIMVIGPNVYWIKDDLTWQKLGSISNLVSRVSMTDDGFGMVLADGVQLYRLDLVTIAFSNTAFGLTNPTDVVFVDGYTIAIGRRSGVQQNAFFWSNLYDNSTWDALDYEVAYSSADPISAIISSADGLYILGVDGFELWNVTGDANFPFKRTFASGGVGIHAPLSICKQTNSVFFIGTTNQGNAGAYMLKGSSAVKISTLALDREWSKSDITDCTAWVYGQDGHDFVIFNFDNMNKTYVYDISENAWHERASRDMATDNLFRWEPNYCIQRNNRILVGDRFTRKLYEMSSGFTTENGNTILRIRTTPHVNAEQEPVKITSLRLDMETGTGITNEDPARYTEPPVIMFRYSQDRARTWSSELRADIGRTGDYLRTVEYTKLGSARNFTVELKISDPCRTVILAGYLNIDVSPRGRHE